LRFSESSKLYSLFLWLFHVEKLQETTKLINNLFFKYV